MTKDNAQREELIEKARRFAIECHGEPTTESHTQQLEGMVYLMADFALEIANSRWVPIRSEADLPKDDPNRKYWITVKDPREHLDKDRYVLRDARFYYRWECPIGYRVGGVDVIAYMPIYEPEPYKESE